MIGGIQMTLKTVRGLVELNGMAVVNIEDELSRQEYLDIIKDNYIFANHKTGTLCFRLQDGPIKEVGVNGCQIDHVVAMVRHIISAMNENYPCEENRNVLLSLDSAQYWLEERRRDRSKRT